MAQENGLGEGDEVNGADLGWERGGVLDWAEGLSTVLVHDDDHDGDVGGCSLLNDDVLNVADWEEVKHGEGEDGSGVDEVISTILELA